MSGYAQNSAHAMGGHCLSLAFMGSIRALFSVSALSSLPSRMIELVQAVCASRALCVAERSSRAVRSRLAESGRISWIF